jgi:hypothetical protein
MGNEEDNFFYYKGNRGKKIHLNIQPVHKFNICDPKSCFITATNMRDS